MGIYKLRTDFGHQLKWWLFGLALLFLISAAFSFGPSMFSGNEKHNGYGDDVVATVNGTDISRGEFDKSWEKMFEMAKSQGVYSPLQLANARQRLFSQMVNNQLLLSAAKKNDVDISDRAVNAEVDKYVVGYLKQNRQAVLGKISKDQEKLDPRDDKKYKDALSKSGYSVGQQEDFAKNQVPVDEIRAQLAIKGLQEKIKSDVKPATAKDITDSYNVYNVRQIILMYRGPKEQVDAKADKILAAAKSGKDFAALAKQNSDMPDKKTGGAAVYSFDTRMMFPPQIQDAVKALKPGEISPVIKTDMGVAIVKLEKVTPKLPAKFDRKVQDQRRKDINNDRQMMAMMKFGNDMQKDQHVVVKDPELLGYWKLTEAQTAAMSDPAKAQKSIKDAESAFANAVKAKQNNYFAVIMLAQVKQQLGKYKEASSLLEPILEGKSASVEGADLRMMLGDTYMQQKLNDKALNQYTLAGEIARDDLNVHQQLMMRYKQLKKADLAAKEQKAVTDLQAKMKAANPAASGAPANRSTKAPAAPAAPKSGE